MANTPTNVIYLNFDTFSAGQSCYSTSSDLNGYTYDVSSAVSCPNSFNHVITLATTINRPTRIALKSAEIPISFPNIRSTSNMDQLSILADGTTYSIRIGDTTVNSITTLLSLINSAFLTAYPTTSIVFSQTASGLVKCVMSAKTSVIVKDPSKGVSGLSYMLGFRSGTNTLSAATCIAPFVYNLNVDRYINLKIANINSVNNNSNGIPGTFKIPLNSVQGVVYFSGDNSSFAQSVEVDQGTPIHMLKVCLYDLNGFAIPSWGSDWSYSLAVFTA